MSAAIVGRASQSVSTRNRPDEGVRRGSGEPPHSVIVQDFCVSLMWAQRADRFLTREKRSAPGSFRFHEKWIVLRGWPGTSGRYRFGGLWKGPRHRNQIEVIRPIIRVIQQLIGKRAAAHFG